jgi:hypothetical protein
MAAEGKQREMSATRRTGAAYRIERAVVTGRPGVVQ